MSKGNPVGGTIEQIAKVVHAECLRLYRDMPWACVVDWEDTPWQDKSVYFHRAREIARIFIGEDNDDEE